MKKIHQRSIILKCVLKKKKDYNVRKYWTRIAIENKMEVVYEQQKR